MSSEDATPWDGFLSTYAEWHALGIGVRCGLRDWRPLPPEPPENEDVQKEHHYYAFGCVVGTLVQWAFVFGILWIVFM